MKRYFILSIIVLSLFTSSSTFAEEKDETVGYQTKIPFLTQDTILAFTSYTDHPISVSCGFIRPNGKTIGPFYLSVNSFGLVVIQPIGFFKTTEYIQGWFWSSGEFKVTAFINGFPVVFDSYPYE